MSSFKTQSVLSALFIEVHTKTNQIFHALWTFFAKHLHRWFGITPFAGLNVTSVHLDPPDPQRRLDHRLDHATDPAAARRPEALGDVSGHREAGIVGAIQREAEGGDPEAFEMPVAMQRGSAAEIDVVVSRAGNQQVARVGVAGNIDLVESAEQAIVAVAT